MCFLAAVGFLRTTYRRQHRGTLPAFVEDDTTAGLGLQFAEYLHGLIAAGGFEALQQRWCAFLAEKARADAAADAGEPGDDLEGDTDGERAGEEDL